MAFPFYTTDTPHTHTHTHQKNDRLAAPKETDTPTHTTAQVRRRQRRSWAETCKRRWRCEGGEEAWHSADGRLSEGLGGCRTRPPQGHSWSQGWGDEKTRHSAAWNKPVRLRRHRARPVHSVGAEARPETCTRRGSTACLCWKRQTGVKLTGGGADECCGWWRRRLATGRQRTGAGCRWRDSSARVHTDLYSHDDVRACRAEAGQQSCLRAQRKTLGLWRQGPRWHRHGDRCERASAGVRAQALVRAGRAAVETGFLFCRVRPSTWIAARLALCSAQATTLGSPG
jgi:hypothetical protein